MKVYVNAFAVLLLLLVGCSPVVEVQKDESVSFSKYKTYAWVETRISETQEEKRAVAFADISVRNAANRALAAYGWKPVDANPDLLISYDVLVERAIVRNSDPVYSQGYYRNYYNPYTRRWHTIYYPSQFLGYDTYDTQVKEGTISVSMMDARTDQLVWQGWTSERLNGPMFTSEELTNAITHIFRKFDPNK
jgi:hypothetical protein